MIVGIGTDLIEIERIKKPVKKSLLVRVYTEEERRQAGEGCPGSPAILR